MFKIKIPNLRDITSDIKADLRKASRAALASTVAASFAQGRRLARQKTKGSFGLWESGYQMERVDEDTWMIAVSGKLALMIEDGIKRGEISKMIMEGPRAAMNKGEGKNYVDVPLSKDANFNLSFESKMFKDADEALKTYKTTKGPQAINKVQALVTRAKQNRDMIRSKDVKTGSVSFLEIKRINAQSIWPKSSKSGIDVLFSNSLERFINREYQRRLSEIL